MYRIILLFVLALSFHSATAYVIETSHTVHFDKDDHELTETQKESLLLFLSTCDLSLEHSFTLEGHTDSDGSVDYNLDLSDRRAETIKSFMHAQDISEKVIQKSFHSELIPIASNALPEGMAQNRRVTIHFLAQYFESVEEVQEQLQEGTENEFIIDNKRDVVVEGEAGVRVFVPENSFVDASGASVESVTVALTESLDPMTFLAHDLQTRTSDGILETGGMIRIEAFGPSGQALNLTEGAAMIIAIPDADRQAGMEIFLTSDDGSTWEQSGPLLEPAVGEEPYIKRPTITIPAFQKPRFVLDQSLRPWCPAEPVEPKAPIVITREAFNKSFSLKYLFQKERRLAQEEANYNYAVRIYDKRKKRYDRRFRKYEKRCSDYTEEYNAFQASLPAWDEEVDRQLKAYEDSIVPAAKALYNDRVVSLKASHQDAIFKYERGVDQRRSEYADAMDKLGIPLGQNVDNYIFRATKLGWVNMDRFTKMKPSQKQEIIARSRQQSSDMDKVFVVLNDGRSMLYLAKDGKDFKLSGFPKDELAELVAYTVIDGKLHMYNELFVGKDEFEIDYRPSSIAELQAMLQQKANTLGCL